MARDFKSISFRGPYVGNQLELERAARAAIGNRVTKNSVSSAIASMLKFKNIENIQLIGDKNGHVIFNVKEALIAKYINIFGNIEINDEDINRSIKIRENEYMSSNSIKMIMKDIINLYLSKNLNRPEIKCETEILENNKANFIFSVKESGNFSNHRNLHRNNNVKKKSVDKHENTIINTDNFGKTEISNLSTLYTENSENRINDLKIPIINTNKNQIITEHDIYSSSWTGKLTVADYVRSIKIIAPKAMSEIDLLVNLVEAERFNDPETDAAINLLKSLHSDLGQLIESVQSKKDKPILIRISRKNSKLFGLIKAGAKVGVIAPSMTIGISYLLSALTKVPVDSTMVSTIFASMVVMGVDEGSRGD